MKEGRNEMEEEWFRALVDFGRIRGIFVLDEGTRGISQRKTENPGGER